MRTNDGPITELATAFAKAQGSIEAATKDMSNPNFGSRYADLAGLWAVARKPLSENGLSVWQEATYAEGIVSVTTRVVHSSGQWVEFGPLGVPLTKHKFKNADGNYEMVWDAHGVGGATTYAKRFAFGAAIGIVAEDEDDDGNTASGRRSAPEPEDLQFHDLRVAIRDAAEELAQRGGGLPSDHIKAASSFVGNDKKEKFFDDAFNPHIKSEKWLKSTLAKLSDKTVASEPGAAEAAAVLS